MAFNHTLTRAALRAADAGDYDVIHAHDWLVAHTAITLAEHLDLPLVTTIHATEAGRHQGWLPEEMNRTIHGVEHWLTDASDPGDRLLRLHARAGGRALRRAGRAGSTWCPTASTTGPGGPGPARSPSARARFAGDGPLVGYAGRLVYEKGVQHLVHAVPRLRERHPGLRVVIAGDGPYRDELEAEARRAARSDDTVSFAGFLDATQLPAMLGATDATVVPSLYEPFGMVALEAAAAGAPLAVAAHRRARRDRRARRHRGDVPAQRPGRARRRGRPAARRRGLRPAGGPPGPDHGRRAVRLAGDRRSGRCSLPGRDRVRTGGTKRPPRTRRSSFRRETCSSGTTRRADPPAARRPPRRPGSMSIEYGESGRRRRAGVGGVTPMPYLLPQDP